MRDLKPPKLIIETKSYRVYKVEFINRDNVIETKFVYEQRQTNTLGKQEFMPVPAPCGDQIIIELAEAV